MTNCGLVRMLLSTTPENNGGLIVTEAVDGSQSDNMFECFWNAKQY
jgi:hypothetical protein